MKSRILFAFIITILIFASLQFVAAAGGNSFDTAESITAGTYTSGPIQQNQGEYYKVEIKPGQSLNINIEASTSDETYLYVSLYDTNRKKLANLVDDLLFSRDRGALSGYYVASAETSGLFYLGVLSDYGIITSYKLTASYSDFTDINSSTDAGASFDSALPIVKGSYPRCCSLYAGGGIGTDKKDIYKISLKKGDKLTVKVTPEETAGYLPEMDISIYNPERSSVARESPSNRGQIVTADYIAPVAGEYYFAVSLGDYYDLYAGHYSLDVNVEGGQKVPGETTGTGTTSGTSGTGTTSTKVAASTPSSSSQLRSLAGYGLVAILIIVISVIYFAPALFLFSKIKFLNIQKATFGRSLLCGLITLIFIGIGGMLEFTNFLSILIGFAVLYLATKLILKGSWGWSLLLSAVVYGLFILISFIIYVVAYGGLGGLAILGFGGFFFVMFLIIAVDIGLLIFCEIEILSKSDNDQSWKLLWGLVCFFAGLIGIIIYFVVGRKSRIPKTGGIKKSAGYAKSGKSRI